MPHLDSSASGDSASGDPASLRLIQSFAGTLSADPDTDPLRTSIRDVLAAHAGGREDAEAAARLTKALADGRLVLTVGSASTVRLASAARASYPNLVAAIAIAMAESATSGTWPRPGQGP